MLTASNTNIKTRNGWNDCRYAVTIKDSTPTVTEQGPGSLNREVTKFKYRLLSKNECTPRKAHFKKNIQEGAGSWKLLGEQAKTLVQCYPDFF